MNITNQLGQLTELWCQIDFCERGIVLSQPTNPSSRYDFIAEIDGKLYRIQCKTAHRESNDRISIRVISKNWSSGEIHNYLNQVDYFYTHWEGKGYLLPIESCTETNREKFIRLGNESQYNNNNVNAIYGRDIEFDVVINKIAPSLPDRLTIENVSAENFENRNKKNKNKCVDCGKEIG